MASSKQDESSFCVWVIISRVLCIVLVNTYSSNQEETKSFNRCCRHADFTNSNDSSCSLRVVLYKTREAIEIGLHCVHTSLVFSEAFKKLNPVFR